MRLNSKHTIAFIAVILSSVAGGLDISADARSEVNRRARSMMPYTLSVTGDSTAETRLLPNGKTGYRVGKTEFYASVDPIEEFVDPAPVSVPDGIPEHGPVARSMDTVTTTLGCEATLWSGDEEYYTFTDEMRLYDTSDSQIAYSTNWDYKPALTGHVQADVNDPAEGNYRCKVDWWVESTYLGYNQIFITVNYLCAGDLEKSKMRYEYKAKGLSESTWPSCSNLQTNHSSTYFSATELNRNGWHSLFWATGALMTGLDGTRTDYGSAITTSNGYRCPEKNAAVGGTNLSYHQFGRGADLVPVSPDTNTLAWRNSIASHAQNNGADTLDEEDHVHVEWEY